MYEYVGGLEGLGDDNKSLRVDIGNDADRPSTDALDFDTLDLAIRLYSDDLKDDLISSKRETVAI